MLVFLGVLSYVSKAQLSGAKWGVKGVTVKVKRERGGV
jgi:hypothetical protein